MKIVMIGGLYRGLLETDTIYSKASRVLPGREGGDVSVNQSERM